MMIPMFRHNRQGRTRVAAASHPVVRAFSLLIAIVAMNATLAGTAAQNTISAADQKCLTCHSMAGLSKSLGDGEKLSLHVASDDFSNSVHRVVGCTGCHREVDIAKHPVMNSIASAREYTLEKTQVCRNCHVAKFEQYEGSIHSSLVQAGDPTAPVCSSCHDVHAVQAMATFEPVNGEPCKSCHEDIFEAYSGSMHGQARVGAGHLQAPICADCHQAHDVQAVAAGDRIKQACLGCHEGAMLAHDEWLPNSNRHLDTIACPVCHSPMAERAVDLRLYDKQSGKLVSETAGNPQFEEKLRSIDTDGDGLDPLELWTMVRDANREDITADVALRGRMEVRSGVEAHQLAIKVDAVRECDTCHQQGASAYENVTVSIASPDGRRIRYAAGEETLTSAVSVDSISGFYTAGGTRIRLLDGFLILGVLAGLAIPVTHMSIRKFFKNKP